MLKMTEQTIKTAPWQDGGRFIAELRENAQLTAAELAEQIAAPSVQWVEEVELGLRPVPSSMYRAYARHLGIPARDFAVHCLEHYDRHAHDALFGDREAVVVTRKAA